MNLGVFYNSVTTIICITIQASVFACIISSYINTCYASTLRALIWIFINFQSTLSDSFE